MKRLRLWVFVGILALTTAGLAAAQSTPEPVVRMGNWVEIGDDVWFNIIGTNTFYYRWTDNVDFDDDVQDLAGSRRATSGSCLESSCDIMQWETRLGSDFRYKKNTTMRVLLEQQNVFDGNQIDGNALDQRSADVHVERAWIDYKFGDTGLRARIGADLWRFDPMSWVGDDDPGFQLWYDMGPFQLYGAAMIQNESQRLGLTNDNDNVYYLFRAAFKTGGHRFSLNTIYQRDRFCPDCPGNEDDPSAAAALAHVRQNSDVYYIMPAWEGKFGILKFIAQGGLVFGEVDVDGGSDLDVFAGAVQIAMEAKLGKITPFFTFLYGTGDDDPNDNDLNGYAALAHKDITLTGSVSMINVLSNSTMFSGIEQGPTFSRAFGLNGRLRSGDNVFNNNLGVNQGYAVTGGYANPGTMVPAIGVRFFPLDNWEIDAHWAGKWIVEPEPLEAQLGGAADIDNFIYHEFGAMVTWTINKYIDVRARGIVALPGDGAKDIAAMANPDNCGRTAPDTCDGDDPMLVGQIRVRGRF